MRPSVRTSTLSANRIASSTSWVNTVPAGMAASCLAVRVECDDAPTPPALARPVTKVADAMAPAAAMTILLFISHSFTKDDGNSQE
jgi:hypothetical protein